MSTIDQPCGRPPWYRHRPTRRRLDRVLRLRRRGWTRRRIAHALGVSERTVTRDLRRLDRLETDPALQTNLATWQILQGAEQLLARITAAQPALAALDRLLDDLGGSLSASPSGPRRHLSTERPRAGPLPSLSVAQPHPRPAPAAPPIWTAHPQGRQKTPAPEPRPPPGGHHSLGTVRPPKGMMIQR